MSELQDRRSVCPHDGPETRGMLASVRGDRIVQVSGDLDHPVTGGARCGKAARDVVRTHHVDRVLDPQKCTRMKDAQRFGPTGRDGALDRIALPFSTECFRDGLHDAEYVRQHTVRFEAVAEPVQANLSERVGNLSGVPADVVELLTWEYATTYPAFIRMGSGLLHHDNRGMAVQTVACVPGMVGVSRETSGDAAWCAVGYAAMNDAALMPPDVLADRAPQTIDMNQLGQAPTELDEPLVMAMVAFNTNPAAIAPERTRFLAGPKREDLFTVVHRQEMTGTLRSTVMLSLSITRFEPLNLYRAFADGRFQTPSGKIESYAERMASDGFDPLPTPIPLTQAGDGEPSPSGSYPLPPFTPPNHCVLHSTCATMPSNIRSEERSRLEIHPEEARSRGILAGDAVRVFDGQGAVQLGAALTDESGRCAGGGSP
jgi:anaerobic selenocysteine-containing dehydrogenase